MRQKLFIAFLGMSSLLFGVDPSLYVSFDKGLNSDGGDVLSMSNGVVLDNGMKSLKANLFMSEINNTDTKLMRKDGLVGKAFLAGCSADAKTANGIHYTRPEGFNSSCGSITMWVKPLDWNGNSKNAIMLAAMDAPNQQLFIYKYWDRKQLYFYYSVDKQTTIVRTPIEDWKQDQWRFITCTWDKDELKVYFNGVLKGNSKVQKVATAPFKNFFLGTMGWKNKIGFSLIDEVKFYQTALNEEQISKQYLKLNAKAFGDVSPVTIRIGNKSAKVDGKVNSNEYAFEGTGFFDARTQSYSATQNKYFLSYDKDNLYVAMISPLEGKLVADKKARDSNLWEDDSIEIHIVHPNNKNIRFQFIFNPNDAIFDAKNGTSSWNAQGITSKSSISKDKWIWETAIPWKDLDITEPNQMRFNLCRSFRETTINTTLGPCLRSYSDTPQFAKLIMDETAPMIILSSFGNLCHRSLDFAMEANSNVTKPISLTIKTINAVLPYQCQKEVNFENGSNAKVQIQQNGLPQDTALKVNLTQDGKMLYDNTLAYKEMTPALVSWLYTNSSTKKMHFTCRIHQIGVKALLQVSLRNQKDGKIVYDKSKNIDTRRSVADVSFDISKIKPGSYDILMKCSNGNGKEFYANTEEINIPENIPAWHNTTAGITNKVPKPWEPLIVKQNKIICWNRQYDFGNNLLDSIITNGNELLQNPIVLLVNGKAVNFKVTKKELTDNGDSAKIVLSGKYNMIPIIATINAEYDGYLWIELTLGESGKSADINDMCIEIPLKRKNLTSFDDNRGIMNKLDLTQEKRTIIQNDLSTMPFFWLGNDEIGLMAGMENLKGWHVRDKSKSMELKLSNDTATILWNLVDTPFKLNKPRTIAFYLQATPVKPKDKRVFSFRENENVRIWSPFRKKYFEYFADDSYDRGHLRQIRNEGKNNNLRIFYYAAPHGVSPYSPDWNYFAWLWHSPFPNLGDYCVDGSIATRDLRNRITFTYACLNSKSFFDYKLDGIAQLVKNPEFKVRNLYYDLSWPKSCSNKAHGCGWVDDFGVQQSTFDIRGTREFNKRTYQMLREKNPNAQFVYHVISTRTPADNFADVLLLGESYDRQVAEKESYYDVFTPELLRIAYNARSNEQEIWLIPQFLRAMQLFNPKRAAQWHNEQPKLDWACRHFLGYMMTHNLGFLNGWSTRKEGYKLYKIQDKLGWDENVVFYPYWKKSPVTVDNKNSRIMCSVYSKNGKALLALLNDTDQNQIVKLTVDTKALFGKKCEIDGNDEFAIEDGIFSIQGDRLEVSVPPRGFKLIFYDSNKGDKK